ncbi:hypothetical protein LguiA_012473 [Lonicera macranthoides]
MTRILVQRGSSGSSSNTNRSSSSLPSSSSSSAPPQPQVINSEASSKEEDIVEQVQETVSVDEFAGSSGSCDSNEPRIEDLATETLHSEVNGDTKDGNIDNVLGSGEMMKEFGGLRISEQENVSSGYSLQAVSGSSYPPPPPVPPPIPFAASANSRRFVPSKANNAGRIGSSRRAAAWPVVSTRSSPNGSRPSSPRSHCENEGYNSADEQSPCFGSSYDDAERERQFEIDIRRAKGLEVKRMLEDGNCLFRAVADQVYGDSELYDLVRQMCIDYMERERDHFSQFMTEGFTSYCKRKRRDKVYGNNMEIQALSEMYNRPIHIYSYGIEPINIFHGSYNTDTPPIRLSYHHGNHYNSLVDPRRLTIGAGLGFSSLQGRNIDRDQIKAAIKAQQDQQIDNANFSLCMLIFELQALLAEGRFYSDLELTEKEIERMVMEASRAEYIAEDKFNKQLGRRDSSTSGAESSSGARPSGSETNLEHGLPDTVLSSSVQVVLSMGFSYLQAMEAYNIFGDDVDSMVCYLLETSSSSSSRRKGKATE